MKGRSSERMFHGVILWTMVSLTVACVFMVVYAVVLLSKKTNTIPETKPALPAIESLEQDPRDLPESDGIRGKEDLTIDNALSMVRK